MCVTRCVDGGNVDLLDLLSMYLVRTPINGVWYLPFNAIKPINGDSGNLSTDGLVGSSARVNNWHTSFGGCNLLRGTTNEFSYGRLLGNFPYPIFNTIAARFMVNIEAVARERRMYWYYKCLPGVRLYKFLEIAEHLATTLPINQNLHAILSPIENAIEFRGPTREG